MKRLKNGWISQSFDHEFFGNQGHQGGYGPLRFDFLPEIKPLFQCTGVDLDPSTEHKIEIYSYVTKRGRQSGSTFVDFSQNTGDPFQMVSTDADGNLAYDFEYMSGYGALINLLDDFGSTTSGHEGWQFGTREFNFFDPREDSLFSDRIDEAGGFKTVNEDGMDHHLYPMIFQTVYTLRLYQGALVSEVSVEVEYVFALDISDNSGTGTIDNLFIIPVDFSGDGYQYFTLIGDNNPVWVGDPYYLDQSKRVIPTDETFCPMPYASE